MTRNNNPTKPFPTVHPCFPLILTCWWRPSYHCNCVSIAQLKKPTGFSRPSELLTCLDFQFLYYKKETTPGVLRSVTLYGAGYWFAYAREHHQRITRGQYSRASLLYNPVHLLEMSPSSQDWQPSPTWVPNPSSPDYNDDQGPIGTATCVAFSVISLLTLVAKTFSQDGGLFVDWALTIWSSFPGKLSTCLPDYSLSDRKCIQLLWEAL